MLYHTGLLTTMCHVLLKSLKYAQNVFAKPYFVPLPRNWEKLPLHVSLVTLVPPH